MIIRKLLTVLILGLCANIALSQVNTFPYSESFEQTFTTGTNVSFITNWTGNTVNASSRIFQGTDARTGSKSLNVIPTSTFNGEVLISLNLTGISNPKLEFYAFSKQNGSSSSSRPVLLSFSTSVDGGSNFLDNVDIGDATTFPNSNTTSFTRYEYELPVTASGESNVIVKMTAARGSGSGSSAELVVDDITISEQVVALTLSSVNATNNATVVATFNQEVTQASAEVVGNYGLDNGITVSSATRTAINEVTLTTSTLSNNNYNLTVNNVEDAASNTPAVNLQQGFSFVTPLSVSTTTVIDKNTLELNFNLELNEASAETVLNYSIDNGIGAPTTATLDPTDSKKVTLALGSDLTENNYTVTINNVTDNSTLATASGLNGTFSYLPLAISSAVANSATEIAVTFNQTVDATSAAVATNYALNFGFGSPTSAVVSASNSALVTLTFATSMVNNTYELTINGVNNDIGNSVASNLTRGISFSTATMSRQIVINEIFADPSGANEPNPVVLPNGSTKEFIELYNTSSKDIDLANFDLSGGTVGSHILAPGGFVILTSSSNVTDFQAFGNTVAVTSRNSLTNSGEQLILKDNLGNIVDSLTYDTNWYRDVDKSDGGWTLEQINPTLSCSDANNWIASTDVRGGSPAAQNSVFDTTPDTTGPELLNVRASSPTEITATFNEIMDQSSLINGTFTMSDGLTVSASTPVTPSLRGTTLTLGSAMTSGTIYTLTVSGVTDCAGNAISVNTLQFLFDNEAPVFQRFVVKDPATVDLIFDESLAKTEAETEANYSINQSVGAPQNATLNASDAKRVRLSLATALTEGTDYVFTYENLTDTLGNTVSVSNQTLNFTNAIDTVIVVSSQLLDVYFTQEITQTSAETVSNYGVDSSINSPKTALQDDDNAKLVHLVFEQAFNDNRNLTISFENLQVAGSNFVQALDQVFVYDTDRPGIDSVVVLGQNNVMVYFDEAISLSSAEAINNYSADNGLGAPASATRQSDQKSVKLTFLSSFTNELANTLSVSGIEDLAQNTFSSTRNVEFTFDELPPSLSSLKRLNPTTLQITFSEVVDKSVAETLIQYTIDNGIGNPTAATRQERDISMVNLVFASLGNNASNTITIAGMTDLNGNVTTTDLTRTFPTNEITLGSLTVLTDSTARLALTKDLTKASAESTSSYSLDNGLTVKSAVQDATDAFTVLLTLSAPMTEDLANQLTISTLTDTDGNTSTDLQESFAYDSQLASMNLVNENTIQLTFDNDLAPASANLAGNYEIDNGIGNPVSAVIDTEDPKKVTLIFSTDLVESTAYQLSISGLNDSFGDIIAASSHSVAYDISPPTVQSVSSTFTNQITVTFSETIEQTSAEILNHFELDNGAGTPAIATLLSSGKEVLLSFANDLTDNTAYNLTVSRVEDIMGNTIATASSGFTFSAPADPAFRDLVINEIYPDPDGSSPLPNAEFIEIYNAGSEAIKLQDFTITDGSSVTTLNAFELSVGDYLILTSTTNADLFSGNVMGLSGFPSLSNTGETITFKRRDGNVVDSLSYDLTYYNDTGKQDGGYTIELVNPTAPCFDPGNYAASTASGQGTPGAQNSVFDNTPDTTVPEVTGLTVVSDQQLRISFNESMDVASIQAADFTLSSGTVSGITVEDEFGTSVLINLTAAFEKGVSLTLTTADLTDCAGNAIVSTASAFFLGATPAANELVITEIMANPTPSQGLPEAEFLEVYNNSAKILSLDGLTLADLTGATSLPAVDVQPGAYLLLTSSSNTNEFTGIEVAGVSSFPSLNTSGDSLAIGDAASNLIFDVVYTTDWYGDDTKAEGGYSLEMINPNAACYDAANWTATNSTNGGTPGAQNAVFDNTPDTTAPEVTGLTVVSDQQLRISFNESMDVASIQAADFTLSSGTVSGITVEDEFGTSVLINLTAAFEKGVSLTLTTADLTDCAGNAIASTASAFFMGATPAANELVITEIMANPTPSQGLPEAEYLEIYNSSAKILSLDGLTLADLTGATSLPAVDIQPGDYLVLTSSSNTGEFTGIEVAGVSSFPSLNTSGDSLAIGDTASNLIFDVVYNTDWYGDDTKAEGGYSLEMINPNAACYDAANWTATNNTNGGTPGAQNAVFDNTPDTTAPEVTGLTVVSDQQLRISFNESMDVASIQATDFTLSSGTVSGITIEDEFGTSVLINLTAAFEKGVSLALTTADLTDCAGNAIASTASAFFMGATPAANELVITEIMANPTPSQGLPEAEFLEVYNNSAKILSLDGLTLADLTGATSLPAVDIQPGAYLLLTSSSNTGEFTGIEVAGVSSFPSLNTSGDSLAIGDAASNLIFDVVYTTDWYGDDTKAEGGYSLEMINPNAACYDAANWTATNSTNGGTPGAQNSVFDNTPDTTAPEVTSLEVISDQQLRISFNESMDVASIQATDFTLSSGTVSGITIEDEFGTSVLINLTAAFEKGVSLTLTTADLTDCAGNAIASTASAFFLGATPAANELVITEIMANPTPSQGLPEAEFLEVYNNSAKILSLDGLTLADLTGATSLPAVDIQPGAYLLLTSSSNTGEFTGIEVAGVSSFPSLNTSGDSLAIGDAASNLIFDVVYTTDWYGDDTKAEGGYSLEMINPNAACYDAANWTATNSTNGGTPGAQNSVFDNTPDTTAPEVTSLEVISDQQLRISFNESMDVASIQATDFTLSSGTVSGITIEDEFGTSVLINLTAAFEKGVSLTLTTADLTDCAGNAIASTASAFFLGATPAANELVITEIMANPTPSQGLPEAEFLEVYNNSAKILSLDGLTLADLTGATSLPAVDIQPGAYLLLTSSSNTGEFTGIEVAGVSSFPSLNTSGDSLAIGDAASNLIFDVVYTTDWYGDDTKAEGGYSLEMINPNAACYDAANWTATNNTNGGTPGAQNSVFDNTPDTTTPEVVSAEIINDLQLKIMFSESMDIASIQVADFSFSNSLQATSINILNEFGTEVLVNLNTNIPRGQTFELSIAGVSDCAGNPISSITQSFVLGAVPSTDQLIITEIMASPSPSQGLPEVDYVEILNTSNITLSLQGLTLADRNTSTSLPNANVAPGAYAVLTTTEGATLIAGAIGVRGFPSLNSSGDLVALANGTNLINAVEYSDNWFRQGVKADGGFSLEMIDTSFPCLEANNWRGSDSPNGGTPGAENSVAAANPDISGPKMLQAVALNDQQVMLSYDEKLAVETITLSSFQISNGITVNSFLVDASKKQVTLTTNETLQSNLLYTVTTDNLTDCSGNLIMDGFDALDIVLALTAERSDLLVNEILFNPRANSVRFVEVYNNSNKFLNLKNWTLLGASNQRVITEDELIVGPGTYHVFTTDAQVLANDYPGTVSETVFELSSLPSFANSSGTVALVNAAGTEIDLFEYSADYHSPLLDNVDGVSLERIRFNATTNDTNNWQSASSTTGFATPGYTNSQSQENPGQPIPDDAILVEPRTFAPDVAGMASFTTINFEFDNPGNVLNVKIFDATGRFVKDIAQNALVGTEGFFRWDGTNEDGTKARVGPYMILFEIVGPDGVVSIRKEPVAIGTRL